MNCEMNFVEEVQTVFYTSRGAALFGQVGCVSLDVGAALTHRFGHLDLEPNDFWTRQVDGRTEGTRDKRRGTERLLTDCAMGACQSGVPVMVGSHVRPQTCNHFNISLTQVAV